MDCIAHFREVQPSGSALAFSGVLRSYAYWLPSPACVHYLGKPPYMISLDVSFCLLS